MTVLLLATPAVGLSCELVSSLCGPEGSSVPGIEAPPCHGMADVAMDCCSIQAPSEPPPAASLDRAELLAATTSPGLPAPLPPSPSARDRFPSHEPAGHTSEQGRYALFSSYLL